MIEQLEISNFRAFSHLKISNCAHLNLVAGRNNCGKTSLLEAIFLLSGAGAPEFVLNRSVVRLGEPEVASDPRAFREALWKPMFSGLDMSRRIEIGARHRSLGDISVQLFLEQVETVQLPLSKAGSGDANLSSEQLSLRYLQGDILREGSCRLGQTGAQVTHQPATLPFISAIVLSHNADIREDAVQLGELRKKKRGDVILEALRAVEPRLQSIEDNSASGVPMIWGDIGLDELVPLPAMGEGMSRLARVVLYIASCSGGVVLVDEIENGFHHSILPKVWSVVSRAAQEFDTQVFATTHSFECVQAADAELEEELALHRLEADDDGIWCVTYARDDISAAIKHGLEVR